MVLLIVVDQFRYDYLERFGDLFGPRGIRRLMREGAVWVNTNYDYMPTKTAPGHAAIATGAPPAATGIVGNEWIDRDFQTARYDTPAEVLDRGPRSDRLATSARLPRPRSRAATPELAKKVSGVSDDSVKASAATPELAKKVLSVSDDSVKASAGTPELAKKILSVSDDSVKALGGGPNESTYSPRLLLAATLGDELRLATNDRAKVIGISDKPRSAILLAGRRANGAYWLSSETDTFVSSDYYFRQLPGWVLEFNRTRPADKYFGAKWERLLPESEYLKRAGPDAPPWENIGNVKGETNAFPHTVTGGAPWPNPDFYDALDHSPFLNELLISFVKQAITNEQFGQDSDTDALLVSLSADDHVGHRFGPYSQEVMDVTLRVDRDIASLLDFVDARIGLRNTTVIFTADHGVSQQ